MLRRFWRSYGCASVVVSLIALWLVGNIFVPFVADTLASRMTASDLTGTYAASYECRLPVLRLLRGGHYELRRSGNTGPKADHRGRWWLESDPEGTYVVLGQIPGTLGDRYSVENHIHDDGSARLVIVPMWGHLDLEVLWGTGDRFSRQ